MSATSSFLRLGRLGGFLLASGALLGAAVVASGLAVGRFFERQALAHEDEYTARIVQTQARQHLRPADFELPRPGVEHSAFEAFLPELPGVFRLKVYDRTGRIVWSDEPRLIGMAFPDNPNLAEARQGRVRTTLEAPEQSEHVYERGKGYVAEAYVPIVFPDTPGVAGVIETYKDAAELVLGIRRTQRLIWGYAGGMGLLLYMALAFVVRRATGNERRAVSRLEAQNRELALVQRFTRSILEPLDLGRLAASVVESAGAGLGLSRSGLFQFGAGGEPVLLAAWPVPVASPPPDLTAKALETRRQVVQGTTHLFPIFTAKGTPYLFLAEFEWPLPTADPSATHMVEIMLQAASIALANAELFTEIREAHERLAALGLLAGIADRMMIVDRQMRIVWMNEVAAEAYGRGESVIGRSCFQVLDGEPEACQDCPAIRTVASGKVERGIRAQRLPNGEVRYLHLMTAPLHDASGRVHQVLEVARDVTDLVEMEERLKQSHAALLTKTEELESAYRLLQDAQNRLVEQERLAAVGEVVVGLHHAILNPLSGILGALQVLKQAGMTHPEQTGVLLEAEAEIRRIEQLIRCLPALRRAAGIPYVGETTMLELERSSTEDEPRSEDHGISTLGR